MHFTAYAAPDTPEEVVSLLENRKNRIAAGNLWLRLSSNRGHTMIDLKNLGWDRIEEEAHSFLIGACVSLHMLETHEGLNRMCGNLFAKGLRSIVGVQLRNAATLGGCVYMRAGFSDLLTMLLPLNASVLLYPEEEIPLKDYIQLQPRRELLRGVRIPKQNLRMAYRSIRNTAGNLPILNCCVASSETGLFAAIGARPGRAVLSGGTGETPEGLLEKVAALRYSTNDAASADYRRHLAKVLTERCLREIGL